ncbi:[citrate (pro-3S)-lyase] ligase [Lactiplantibacillus dongliensis]|uniref:[Citrate [pro-3S]-lyase] ligase n=1 Tax=Lactiplantibacillus dongliensis TaxID=2559919 RepID=A0ABW1R3L0_9LACO|nr:[citrate (pro-3S)-lyase] ligase [Lactiplantibacillus dongliensis]
MDEVVVDLYLSHATVKAEWQAFLTSLGITNFSAKEVDQLDFTLGIYQHDQLVATGSVAGNVLKYIGVCNKGVTAGARFNMIVSELINRAFHRQNFHLMVFTKSDYAASFQHLGFQELAHSATAALLETGNPNISDYLKQLPRVQPLQHPKIGSIVMNANPFTKGHRYLVEQAALENDYVYVFVVHAEASLFKTKERFELVRAGTADLANVMVIDGGEYMVSYATFPAYFLKSTEEVIKYQTTLDARLFRESIAPALGITSRYVGSEPLSRTTSIYNDVLKAELPPVITLTVVDRKQTDDGNWITATQVRQLIATHQIEKLAGLVPPTTLAFIEQHQEALLDRIRAGVRIAGN